MYFKLFVFLLCVSYGVCQNLAPSVICENTTIHSSNVRMEVSECNSDHEHCPLYRGTNHTVTFTFQPTADYKNKTDFKVFGVFEKFSVPYGRKTDACELAIATDDETSCKMNGGFEANREYKHTSKFSVSNNYPLITLKVRFVMSDRRSKNNLLCVEVPVEINTAPETTSATPVEENETR